MNFNSARALWLQFLTPLELISETTPCPPSKEHFVSQFLFSQPLSQSEPNCSPANGWREANYYNVITFLFFKKNLAFKLLVKGLILLQKSTLKLPLISEGSGADLDKWCLLWIFSNVTLFYRCSARPSVNINWHISSEVTRATSFYTSWRSGPPCTSWNITHALSRLKFKPLNVSLRNFYFSPHQS